MSVKFVFNDIDGCLGKFSKPKYPDKQELKDHLSSFERLKIVCRQMPETKFGVATGRSVHESDNIIHLLGFTGYSICEMGNVIYSSKEGSWPLYKKMDLPNNCRAILDKFINWRESLDLDTLSRQKFPNTGVQMLKDRVCMLTFEFKKNIGDRLVEWLYKFFIDHEMKEAIEDKYIKIVVSSNAVDIMPFLDKSIAIKYLSDNYGVILEQTLGIGDSYHSDYDFMNKCGFVACPNNSDPQIKELARSKKERGYISDKPLMNGNIDLIDYASRNWI